MKTTSPRNRNARRDGFSLVELLAAIAVVSILGSIVYAASSTIYDSVAKTKEISSARNLITTFLIYPSENGGKLPKGYGQDTTANIRGFDGDVIPSGEFAAQRWPWKVANMMSEGAMGLYIEEHMDLYQHLNATRNNYDVSLVPSFGMNITFVGGNYNDLSLAPDSRVYADRRDRTGTRRYPSDYCVTQLSKAYEPSSLIVFISSLSVGVAEETETAGYFRVDAPIMPTGMRWAGYSEKIPANMGYVHLRRDEGTLAVVANLDGSVELLNEDELRDMRRWSNQAAAANNPNFTSFQD